MGCDRSRTRPPQPDLLAQSLLAPFTHCTRHSCPAKPEVVLVFLFWVLSGPLCLNNACFSAGFACSLLTRAAQDSSPEWPLYPSALRGLQRPTLPTQRIRAAGHLPAWPPPRMCSHRGSPPHRSATPSSRLPSALDSMVRAGGLIILPRTRFPPAEAIRLALRGLTLPRYLPNLLGTFQSSYHS